MGAANYEAAVACGDVLEKPNSFGKMMAYEYKEKLQGIREASSACTRRGDALTEGQVQKVNLGLTWFGLPPGGLETVEKVGFIVPLTF